MSSTRTESIQSASGPASSHNPTKKQLWDQNLLNSEHVKLEQWAKTSITGTERIFVPKKEHCGIWDESPNKARYASFGEGGTTASVSCYGDLIQMSQYVGVGNSGVFTIDQDSTDQDSTPEPYRVADRAQRLDELARNMGSKFSFLLIIPDDCCPEEGKPPEVSWVNWRWPRYQYNPPDNSRVKCCYQFMVHDGVVLQQFTLENITETEVEVGSFEVLSKVLIRDLDFLDGSYPFNETPEIKNSDWSDDFGPDGYGHVYMHMLQGHGDHCGDGCTEHAVASVTTTFYNGSAVQFNPQDENSSVFLKEVNLGGTASGQNKVEIVLARKLLILPNRLIDWRNFVISAAAGDINHWLREEKALLAIGDDQRISRCLAKLPIPRSEESGTNAARNDGASQGKAEKEPESDRSDDDEDGGDGVQMHEGCEYFEWPTKTPKSIKNWDPNNHLEFFAWRHLEHILSVCAVPLSKPGLINMNGEVEILSRDTSPPVALTCGDMSGHRINTSASFFAFQFLVDVGRRLRLQESKTKYTRSMEMRIKDVCTGHLKWLNLVRTSQDVLPVDPTQRPPCNDDVLSNEHLLQVGCFAANYWVTGKVMYQSSRTWQPQNRMTDTAFQVLKLAEYAKLVPLMEMDRRLQARDLMQDIYIPWLTELGRLDIRETFCWPHSSLNGVIKFRLGDHFWIWKALKCLDKTVTKIRLPSNRRRGIQKEILEEHRKWLLKLYHDSEEVSSAESEDLEGPARRFLETTKRLSPINVQRTALQRFTVENDVLKPARRLLAVTRSAMDTRFLFHGSDAVLFSKEGNDFFMPGSPVMQLWKSTIDAQLHHEDNIYTDSDNALRYALGITTGVRGYALNNANNASDMMKRSVNVLIGASGSDAFFPGYLDEEGRGPTIFADEVYRDRFYHAGFEINYILLSSATKIRRMSSGSRSSPAANPRGGGPPVDMPVVAIVQRQPSQLRKPTMITETGTNLQVTSDKTKTICSFDNRPAVVMKKFLPFTNSIPPTDVNYIGDEWLYRYPDFLRGRLDGQDFRAQIFRSVAESPPEMVVSWFHERCERAHPEDDFPGMGIEQSCGSLELYVLDIRKRKRHVSNTQKIEDKVQMQRAYSAEEICDVLRAPRTAWSAKKRIITLPHMNPVAAYACCVFSPVREKNELRRFFRLHALYTKDVLDEASMMRNEWQTELHLSFYLLVEDDNPTNAEAVLSRHDNVSFSFFGHSDLQLRRASMSFRFDGDFFDRYWTCHFIEHMPKKPEHMSNLKRPREGWDHPFTEKNISLEKKWSQRKVLELYFLDRILGKMNSESSKFLTEIRKMLEIGEGSLAFASLAVKGSMNNLQRFENILDLVEEDLMANIATLRGKWDHREADRGGEQPRWTRNDEAKYRTAINKYCVDLERATGQLQANCDSVRKLKEFLATTRKNRRDASDHESNERDRVRAERDSLRDADIRYLTYVTVIFQPLGFAASFYGMGGAPESALIVSLVEFSAAAFAVTIFLIWAYRELVPRLNYDAALEKLSTRNKPVENYLRSRSAFKDKRFSLQLVVQFIAGTTDKLVRWLLVTAKLCLAHVYEKQIVVGHRETGNRESSGV